MFDLSVIERIVSSSLFTDDYGRIRQGLALHRAGQTDLFDEHLDTRMGYFVESVLASAPDWRPSSTATDTCRIAAEVAELLSVRSATNSARRRFRIRAALLYEMADFPAIAAAVLEAQDFSRPLVDLFARRGLFKHLVSAHDSQSFEIGEPNVSSFVESTLFSDVRSLVAHEQGASDIAESRGADLLELLSRDFGLETTTSELAAWNYVLKKRASFAARRFVSESLVDQLRAMKFPPELWSSQVEAVNSGLLDRTFDAWGLAAPTGTGKTFLTRLAIADTLRSRPDSIVLYIVPSRALVHEISSDLHETLSMLGYNVTAVTPQLVALDETEASELSESSVLVMTPEKADLLLRLRADVFDRMSLVIVDEAHHIESATRGVLLEMYLWRLRRALDGRARFVFLSAVAPNIDEIVGWLGSNPASAVIDKRATRMRVGVFSVRGTGKKAIGIISYSDGASVTVMPEAVDPSKRKSLVQLAIALMTTGPVLIVAKGKKECETLALLAAERLRADEGEAGLSDELVQNDIVQRLDACLEREMYPEVSLRALIANRIAYHHAGLPPNIRSGIEDAIRHGLVDYVFATTTLAEGVNFPFSTVIVQSLALRGAPEKGRPAQFHPVTPRAFWNIAGRAGRPGHDREGQVVLFEPTLGLDKIGWVISDYLNPVLSSINPVRSALADGICEIEAAVSGSELPRQALESPKLPPTVSKRVQGAINLLRVSLLHARASHVEQSPQEIYESTFAARFLSSMQGSFARELFSSQDSVVLEFLTTPGAPPAELIAELGLSIETLTDLREWVASLPDWRVESIANLLYGGKVNLDQAKYVLSPIAKRMSELEGPKLGGFLGDIIVLWISGVPFNSIWRNKRDHWQTRRIEDLISVVYSRIQYLLPWGLYATDRLLEAEARRRKLTYDNQLRSLAYLADAGVPSFDALRLASLKFERGDATRLANLYQESGGLRSGTDIIEWVAAQPMPAVVTCVRGADRHRLDFDFERRIEELASH